MRAPDYLLKKGITSLVCVGDGRQSGTSGSPSILNASPEAASNGPLALIETGDRVVLDLNEGRLDLLVDDAELQRRRDALAARGGYRYPESQTPWQEIQREPRRRARDRRRPRAGGQVPAHRADHGRAARQPLSARDRDQSALPASADRRPGGAVLAGAVGRVHGRSRFSARAPRTCSPPSPRSIASAPSRRRRLAPTKRQGPAGFGPPVRSDQHRDRAAIGRGGRGVAGADVEQPPRGPAPPPRCGYVRRSSRPRACASAWVARSPSSRSQFSAA